MAGVPEIACPKCNGRGRVLVTDQAMPCEATLDLNHETIDCYASRQHPGEPHMAILCEPCMECGGYEEHAPGVYCASYLAEPNDPPLHWWQWRDGDLALTRAPDGAGQEWRNRYQPDSPHARAS